MSRGALERTHRASPCPAIVVHGRDDPIPLASWEAVARALGAELVVLDGAGHLPYVDLARLARVNCDLTDLVSHPLIAERHGPKPVIALERNG